MAILGSADIAAILADLKDADGAVEVTLGSTTVIGLFDRTAIQIFDDDMPTTLVDGESVHVQADTLPGLQPGAALIVDGVAYKALRVLAYGEGAMVRIALRTPTP